MLWIVGNLASYHQLLILDYKIISTYTHSEVNSLKFHLTRNNLPSNKQYGFCPSRSIADVLKVITHRISEILDGTSTTKAITLDSSKAFHKVWHRLLLKLSSYDMPGIFYVITKSFFSGSVYESCCEWL